LVSILLLLVQLLQADTVFTIIDATSVSTTAATMADAMDIDMDIDLNLAPEEYMVEDVGVYPPRPPDTLLIRSVGAGNYKWSQ
jgi:hypothetical protein